MKVSLVHRRPRLLPRPVLVVVTLALTVSTAACGARSAGDIYPQRAVQVVVPFPAGSGIDTTTRALVDIINASGDLDNDLQVVNRDGGGGSVGVTQVLNAKPDGYTIGVVPDGPLTLLPQTQEVAYDPTALTAINEIITFPIIFVVPKDSPYEDLQDLVDAAEADPGAITIGEGPLNYAVPADQFEQETGVRLKHVDFEGDQATTTALLGKNLDVGVMQLASALPQLGSGDIRALGVTSPERVDLIPDVPTFGEQGIDIVWEAFNTVIAPDGLPPEIADTLVETVADAVASDDFASTAETLGLIVSGAGPDEAVRHLEEKTKASAPILEASQ
ncbi:tripartite tricarboxylate transporter substrate binding protein [Nocardioides hwasunensis]|uniref:Tripartite tricarboxylate transporter substrate binding protein n=1 Tax=Nocardioides hwasunensis TaxID=397258 RepID=A0ABR8MK34_9ACTN|nr:tripartite tricarboxylate transporter substrate binding protein [Nocardioides hwasunensis]MBD3916373.1 tripartite tricarboxylate transporter substrate binding protein [Nocardioides hwasunensis]